MATKIEVATLLDDAQALYPRMEVKTETVEAWYRILSDIRTELLSEALTAYARESRFAPHPSDIRNKAVAMTGNRAGELEDAATTREEEEAYRKQMLEAGYVRAMPLHPDDKPRWVLRQHCVQQGDLFYQKIDFVMDKLGAGTVSRILREELYGYSTPGKVSKILADGKFPWATYNRVLSELVELATSN